MAGRRHRDSPQEVDGRSTGRESDERGNVRRQLEDVAGPSPAADRLGGGTGSGLALVYQGLGGLLPLRTLEQAWRRGELLGRRVPALATGHHDELLRLAHAGDRLLLRPWLLLRQEVDPAVLVDEPGRDHDAATSDVRTDPDHVGLPESILDVLRQLRRSGLDIDGKLDLT